ncbi:DUF4336 domain-containing protein [Caulobacter sp. KR2-114]|uniref:DUF4336 domain-containing protein n=1 Tax=Caulobacter sp. KR2-114 TaxID=3400912 RepID=UPI003C0D7C46
MTRVAPAFDPYGPPDAPRRIARGLWIVDGPEIRFHYLGLAWPFPTRMTILALADGGLWLHSPVQPTGRLFAAVERLGPVRHLIAPNTLHYWWIPEWKARFPDAVVHLAPGLAARSKQPLPPGPTLSPDAPSAWRGQIDQVVVRGDALTEVVFFHRASRTLILADLIENFEPERVHSRWLRAVLRLGGAVDPCGQAPIDMQLSFWRARRQVRHAARQMVAWGPVRVILAHGRWYRRDAVTELRRAFRWTGLS